MRSQLAFLALSFFLSTAARANTDVKVNGRAYMPSCSYMTNVTGDFEVTLQDESIAWGSSVDLIFGFFGRGERGAVLDWTQKQELQMPATGPYRWSQRVTTQLARRGGPEQLEALQFVFRIREASGKERYLRGGRGEMAFFEARLPTSLRPDCVRPGQEFPAYVPMNLKSVHRN